MTEITMNSKPQTGDSVLAEALRAVHSDADAIAANIWQCAVNAQRRSRARDRIEGALRQYLPDEDVSEITASAMAHWF
jgi:hypothetical protein